eukprot:366157-Chlamydomonas_euryale.AAC.16
MHAHGIASIHGSVHARPCLAQHNLQPLQVLSRVCNAAYVQHVCKVRSAMHAKFPVQCIQVLSATRVWRACKQGPGQSRVKALSPAHTLNSCHSSLHAHAIGHSTACMHACIQAGAGVYTHARACTPTLQMNPTQLITCVMPASASTSRERATTSPARKSPASSMREHWRSKNWYFLRRCCVSLAGPSSRGSDARSSVRRPGAAGRPLGTHATPADPIAAACSRPDGASPSCRCCCSGSRGGSGSGPDCVAPSNGTRSSGGATGAVAGGDGGAARVAGPLDGKVCPTQACMCPAGWPAGWRPPTLLSA